MTEHRLGETVWGVAEFMSGAESLDGLLEQLRVHKTQQNLASLLLHTGQ